MAAALRLAALGTQPGGLFQDEAAEGWDALRLLHQPGFHPLYFDDDGGREPAFAYLLAAVFRAAGASPLTLRATAAVIGILAVAAIALALRRFGTGVMLAGSAWAAGSLWLVCVSRDGMRTITVPLAGALALWALLRWEARPTAAAAAVAGAVCGAGLWTYQPLKLTPLLVALWLPWLRHSGAAIAWRTLRWGVAAYAAVAAPMLYVAVTDPGGYFGHGFSVIAATPGDPLPLHVLRTLGMFGITGDPNQRHDVDALPLVATPVALLASWGAVVCWRRRRDGAHALVLLGAAVFMVPPLVALQDAAPHGLRSLGVVPFVAALAGIGAAALTRAASQRVRHGAAVAVAATAVLLCALAAATAMRYFSRPLAARYDAYSVAVTTLAGAARPGDTVIVDGYAAPIVEFLDSGAPPRIAAPGTVVREPAGGAVLALDRRDLVRAVGAAAAARAQPVGRRPDGTPAGWRTVP